MAWPEAHAAAPAMMCRRARRVIPLMSAPRQNVGLTC
jgi:hypothetical protein